ncbi:MAG TPA: type II toxin-antitoxin system Phd/YefM family antitoxin [Candidatus Competibacteraceae bacterium]|nr:MAG: type II toxin-antitoxin system Phd/YefM family antitoxin [Candidatus Competibacteraceae bacterium]HOB62853.1 type II toxin-antitoxin system Phd/YefM family antitoxin [Candidatus Competibacteraceae bacterium]HQA27130.1 type II toxin-antitoxin system Phd/YefM family antitoxin [Candidatus Competibacteraceae bacterium]HQD57351.1 type II toxin-antitoxin system Phd/YefM family antitoxin [Candidatus Competibacteraceae bacterium]
MPTQTVIAAGDFKARCLKLLDEVAETREPLLITKHGKAVAKLVPVPPEQGLFGALAGSVLAEGDLIAPLDDDWDACR